MELLATRLGPDEMSVGYAHESRHLRPAVGAPPLKIEAILESFEAPFAAFKVKVTQGERVIVEGKHTRAIIGRQRFLARLQDLSTSNEEA
ncbi:hypothetical protein METEAL_38660 [Mesoterricola silvestris]|uniref:Fluoroacetyl-CoA-specific thioesterase-like domain-containing protein n=2 Tax=Mesoterricola silvestris TaxID=2927979 RepID=A0AA48KBU8_9BACT|nr:hypothetical protein [Mesoterricola silvestris]BDU74692.1 hypothetical protein METEAL_38660 [Mesoterricola silvestris]